MGFLDKLKKTLWDSFFGSPEPPKKRVDSAKTNSKKAAKRKPAKKITARRNLKRKKPLRKTDTLRAASMRRSVEIKAQSKKSQPKKKHFTSPQKPQVLPQVSSKKIPRRAFQGVLAGHVTHFFPQVRAAAIKIDAQNLSVGDEILIKGESTHYKVRIESMQINRSPVTQAGKGSEIGILVKKRVREGDEVYKL